MAARLEAIARAAERRSASRHRSEDQHRSQHGTASGTAATRTASAEDLDRVVDALHEQTDVLRALIEIETAVRDDARSTAQNSRTFAIAGIVIAFFTLVAAAVPIVTAVVH